MLVTKPERTPGAVGGLCVYQIPPRGGEHPPLQCSIVWGQAICRVCKRRPALRGPDRMRGDVGARRVERQPAPATAECWQPAVAVGEMSQPVEPRSGRPPHLVRGHAGLSRFELRQCHHGAAGIVGIGNAAGQIGPRPAAGCGAGIGMHTVPLLAKQPVADRLPLTRPEMLRQPAAGGERRHRLRRHPGGEVRVDRPRAVGPLRLCQKSHTSAGHCVRGESHAGQAHRHERCQRRRLEITAIVGLDCRERAERGLAGGVAEGREHAPRRREGMPHLPDGDQRGKRVAHHLHVDQAKPSLRQRRQFERQLRNHPPCLGRPRIAEPTAEGDVREDRHAERPVAAIDGRQRRRDRARFEAAGLSANPVGSPVDRGRRDVAGGAAVGHRANRRPTEERGGEVSLTGHGVAPAAIGQLRCYEPLHAGLDPRGMRACIDKPQGVDRRRRGERAR